MKITLRKCLYLITLISLSLGAKAQYAAVPDTVRIGVGVEGASAGGKFGDSYNFGVGASVQIDVPITPKIYVTANAGYLSFMPDNNNIGSNPIAILNTKLANMNLAPLKIGLKYYLIRTFYIQAEVGETLLLNKSDVYALNGSAFTYAPQMGILFKLKKKSYIDAGFKLQWTQSFYGDGAYNNFVGVRAAYAFNLK